ncbi:MAG: CPBP family intramembrane glutamic endopeptidase [Kiritimatiellia bacterium]|jgi:membrane protease YdiL (CAAX protease family)|nr:CPBP family intramembrane metalloprotease [Kiritimatiellia bacterium]MDD4174765.1 CPBP family intramembrane metalloprotease [Kiritimatiellia bacterium]MDD4442320.1 CPBP family intramembrane metalloprotease [Kiritimatiellia bacterium]MDX9793311.1 CPBP family intramembrane glutamic endopeptidase [Kiritimatiellia bacterium]NLC81230.1 CPBP family intramembrane metalloprotease [Lentisphaerota bacterium]
MACDPGDTTRLACLALSGGALLLGVSADFALLLLVQARRLTPRLPARAEWARGPFAAAAVQLALAATLLFALPTLFSAPQTEPAPARALLSGSLLYAVLGGCVVAASLIYARAPFAATFFGPCRSSRLAILKGLFFGFAALPPVALISQGVGIALDAFGLEQPPQEVFQWLGDGSVPCGMRVGLITAAVLIAPTVEEFVFRGILFRALLRHRRFAYAALLSGAYFALVHLHAPSFLPLLALSAAFSAGYAATGSILTPIVMHALFNAVSLLAYFAGSS